MTQPPILFKPEMFTNDCLSVVKDHGEDGEVFLGEGYSGHDALTILVSIRAQAIFEKWYATAMEALEDARAERTKRLNADLNEDFSCCKCGKEVWGF